MSGLRFSRRPNRAHQIRWQDWDSSAFQTAQARRAPVLLSISAVWCHWCHVMDETSFSDPEIIDLINRRFVPVRVDSDQRPDVNSRYNMGGWPTVAFLTGSGDIIAGATYMAPQQLKGALERVSREYAAQGEDLSRQAGQLGDRRRTRAGLVAAGPGIPEIREETVDAVLDAVVEAFDPQHGGFGAQPKFPSAPSVELLLHTHRTRGEARYLEMAHLTLDRMMEGGLMDMEEGGFFRYSTYRDWSAPHYEKLLRGNADLLHLYLGAHLLTGRQEYARAASGTAGYLMARLYDKAAGAFYGSQDADEEYYSLPLARRLEGQPPVVDAMFYTGANAAAASALLEAAWLLDRPDLRQAGLGAIDYLLKQRERWGLRHGYPAHDSALGIAALLDDYVQLVTALLDAYSETSVQRYLDGATALDGEMTAVLEDPQGGGFFDISLDPAAIGALQAREKPLNENAAAAQALVRLHSVTAVEGYRKAGERALSGFVPVYRESGQAAAGYALAVHRFLHTPVEITVVGIPGRESTRSLVAAAARVTCPHVEVRLIDAGDEDRLSQAGYWPAEEAQAYVCLNSLCLPPISDPQELDQRVAEQLEAPAGGMYTLIPDILLDTG